MCVVGVDYDGPARLQIFSTTSTCATEVSMNHTNLIPFNVSLARVSLSLLSSLVCVVRAWFSSLICSADGSLCLVNHSTCEPYIVTVPGLLPTCLPHFIRDTCNAKHAVWATGIPPTMLAVNIRYRDDDSWGGGAREGGRCEIQWVTPHIPTVTWYLYPNG